MSHPPALDPRLSVGRPTHVRLTRREYQVAWMIARGLAAKEIAAALRISIHTVRRHSEHIFLKLGVHTRSAVAWALVGSSDGERDAA